MFMFKQDTHLLDSLSSTFALEISLVLIRFLSLLSILGLNLFFILIYMDVQLGEASQQPNKDVTQRLKKLMVGVQSEFRGHESAIGSTIFFIPISRFFCSLIILLGSHVESFFSNLELFFGYVDDCGGR